MRNISFQLTKPQILARTKTVTRRLGWWNLRVGELLQGCEKCMGRRKGEPLVKLAVVRVVSLTVEPLGMLTENLDYGFAEIVKEGFGDHPTLRWPSAFVPWFCSHHKGCDPFTLINRIEFEYVDTL